MVSRERFTIARMAPVSTSIRTAMPARICGSSAIWPRRARSAMSWKSMFRVVRTSLPSTAFTVVLSKSRIYLRSSVTRRHSTPSVPWSS